MKSKFYIPLGVVVTTTTPPKFSSCTSQILGPSLLLQVFMDITYAFLRYTLWNVIITIECALERTMVMIAFFYLSRFYALSFDNSSSVLRFIFDFEHQFQYKYCSIQHWSTMTTKAFWKISWKTGLVLLQHPWMMGLVSEKPN